MFRNIPFFHKQSTAERIQSKVRKICRKYLNHPLHRHTRLPLTLKLGVGAVIIIGSIVSLYLIQTSTDIRKKATLQGDSNPVLIELVKDRVTNNIRIKRASKIVRTQQKNNPHVSQTNEIIIEKEGKHIDSTSFSFTDAIPVDDFDQLMGKASKPAGPTIYALPEPYAVVEIELPRGSTIKLHDIKNNRTQTFDTSSLTEQLDGFAEPLSASIMSNIDPYTNQAETLDIAIVSNGYEDFNQFHQDVESLKKFMLTIAPFSTYSSHINFHQIDNTANLECYHPSNIPRLIVCSEYLVRLAASEAPYDTIIVIHNSDVYGGSGSIGIAVGYRGEDQEMDSSAKKVIVHEVGHSLGLLADEYSYGTEYFGNNIKPNCDRFPTCEKWQNVPDTGCYQTCAYTNLFRPTYNDSLMRTLTPDNGFQFGPVSKEHMASVIRSYINLNLESDSDLDGDVDFLDYQILINQYSSLSCSNDSGTDCIPGLYQVNRFMEQLH